MKVILIGILTGVAVLLAISSCATVSKEPLAPGQVRLLKASIPGTGLVYLGTPCEVNVTFEANGKPTLRRACFSFSSSAEGPSCYAVRPRDVEFGTPGSLTVTLPPPNKSGPSRVDCFVEYLQDTKILRTNVIHFSIDAF